MSEKCKGTCKDGRPCPMNASSRVTPGWCLGHDPGITIEMRRAWVANRPKLDQKRKINLKTVDEILTWVEDMVNEFAEKVPKEALNAEVLQVYAELARVALACVKEKNGKKETKKNLGWRASG